MICWKVSIEGRRRSGSVHFTGILRQLDGQPSVQAGNAIQADRFASRAGRARSRRREAASATRTGSASPKRTYGVTPCRPVISTSRMPRVNHGRRASSRPSCADRRGDARVRRAQQRPAGLERAHRRDLVVLERGERAAVPGVVGDVDEERRVRRLHADLRAERILVADVDGHALAGDLAAPADPGRPTPGSRSESTGSCG